MAGPKYIMPLLNLSDLSELTYKIEQLPWQYEPTKEELEALEKLRQMIEDYQKYLSDTKI